MKKYNYNIIGLRGEVLDTITSQNAKSALSFAKKIAWEKRVPYRPIEIEKVIKLNK